MEGDGGLHRLMDGGMERCMEGLRRTYGRIGLVDGWVEGKWRN